MDRVKTAVVAKTFIYLFHCLSKRVSKGSYSSVFLPFHDMCRYCITFKSLSHSTAIHYSFHRHGHWLTKPWQDCWWWSVEREIRYLRRSQHEKHSNYTYHLRKHSWCRVKNRLQVVWGGPWTSNSIITILVTQTHRRTCYTLSRLGLLVCTLYMYPAQGAQQWASSASGSGRTRLVRVQREVWLYGSWEHISVCALRRGSMLLQERAVAGFPWEHTNMWSL